MRQIAEFNRFSLEPAAAGVFVADDRKGHRPGAGQEIDKLFDSR